MIVIYANLFDTARKILTIMKQIQNQLNSERYIKCDIFSYFVKELSINAKANLKYIRE